jgi:hypothetical protein
MLLTTSSTRIRHCPFTQEWWCTPVSPACGRLRQEDLEYKIILIYIENLRSPQVIWNILSQKKTVLFCYCCYCFCFQVGSSCIFHVCVHIYGNPCGEGWMYIDVHMQMEAGWPWYLPQSLLLLTSFLTFYVHGYLACMCLCTVSVQHPQKRELDPLELT